MADTILDKAKTLNITPNRVILNSYVRACASCNGTQEEKAEALQAAQKVLSSMQESEIGTDHRSYLSMLHCFCRLIDDPEECQRRLAEIFHACCKEGMVHLWFLQAVRQYATDETYLQLTSLDPKITPDSTLLPKEWTRNVIR